MRVCFDVHGSTLGELRALAQRVLAEFVGGPVDDDVWHVDIDVHEESSNGLGHVVTWRGEVTAECR